MGHRLTLASEAHVCDESFNRRWKVSQFLAAAQISMSILRLGSSRFQNRTGVRVKPTLHGCTALRIGLLTGDDNLPLPVHTQHKSLPAGCEGKTLAIGDPPMLQSAASLTLTPKNKN